LTVSRVAPAAISLDELSLPEYFSNPRGPDCGFGKARRGVGDAEALVFWPFTVPISKSGEIFGAVATRATKHIDTIDREQITDREPGKVNLVMEKLLF